MRKFLIFVSISLLTLSNVNAQTGYDFGVRLGGTNYFGEIGGGAEEARPFLLDFSLDQTNFAFGGFFRYNFSRNFAGKLAINYARIEGADSLSENPNRIGRNLSFRTTLIEATLSVEYNLIQMRDLSRRSRQNVNFRTYIMLGGGVLLYYPEAQLNDDWFSLRPLMTEGEENAYNEMTIAIPAGGGAEFTFNDKFRIGLEAAYRFTFTDYLDDVSTRYVDDPSTLLFDESRALHNRSDEAFARGHSDLPSRNAYGDGSVRGNPDSNDGYLMFQISVSYFMKSGSDFYRPRYNSIINRRRKRTKF